MRRGRDEDARELPGDLVVDGHCGEQPGELRFIPRLAQHPQEWLSQSPGSARYPRSDSTPTQVVTSAGGSTDCADTFIAMELVDRGGACGDSSARRACGSTRPDVVAALVRMHDAVPRLIAPGDQEYEV
jgi:hypothetical protein